METYLMILVSFPLGKTSGNLFNPCINVPIQKKSGNLFYDRFINKSAHTKNFGNSFNNRRINVPIRKKSGNF